MRPPIAFIFALFALVIAFPVFAQDTPNPPLPAECTAETMMALITDLQSTVSTALAATQSNDLITAANTMYNLNHRIGAMRALCDGLVFSGDSYEVIGPVKIPSGVYRVVFTTDYFGTILQETIAGDCGLSGIVASSGREGEASQGNESIFTSENCQMLLESKINAPWQLRFEKVA